MKKTIGFIGQGWIGKNYANHFEDRGFSVIRYALEEPYISNRDRIRDCDIVFIAVPTPTVPGGFDDHIVREAVSLVGKGKIAVIKSTILPGTTESVQEQYPDVIVLHSPEFLTEATARYDADNPDRNIVGIPRNEENYREAARAVLEVLPESPFNSICSSREAELIKYGGNCFFYSKVIFMNILFDLAKSMDCDWQVLKEALAADPRIGRVHMDPVHKSGRGAGGHCFIKDFEAFSWEYKKRLGNDILGVKVLDSIRDKNLELLLSTNKDLDLLEGVYGSEFIRENPQAGVKHEFIDTNAKS